MMTNYISQFTIEKQSLIERDVIESLKNLGYEKDGLIELTQDAMDSRLCDLNDLIDINPYLKKEGWILK